MKKIILSISTIFIIFTSCSDYLEEEVKHSSVPDELYLTDEGFEGLLIATYSELRKIYGDDPYLFASGTDLYADGKEAGPPGLTRYTSLSPTSEGVGELYDDCFRAIRVANTALHYGELIAQQGSAVNTREGEVRYLRASYYFLLVQTYGGVPLITDPIDTPIFEYDRESAENIYEFIVSELELALTLVDEGTYDGHVTKRAVHHLLAKVHLTRGYESFAASDDFSEAASYADAAIAGQTLNLSFEELWAPGNEMNEEIIFSVQYSPESIVANPNELGNSQRRHFGPYMGGGENADKHPNRVDELGITRRTLELFTEDDERYSASFMEKVYTRYYDYYDVPVEDHSSLPVIHYYVPRWGGNTPADSLAFFAANPGAPLDGFHSYGTYFAEGLAGADFGTIPLKKFDSPTDPYGQSNSSRDIILSRLGETYLIAAEAYLQAGQPGTGLLRLNEVRRRAGVADALISEFDIDYILEERGRELLGEYHRWFDLKRTGKLVEYASAYNYQVDESNFQGNNGELKILRPIPQTAIDLNQNKDFPQNPAYE